MSPILNFDPPADMDDFDFLPNQRAAWDEFISLSFQRNIESVRRQ